jgi:hypothetical protein
VLAGTAGLVVGVDLDELADITEVGVLLDRFLGLAELSDAPVFDRLDGDGVRPLLQVVGVGGVTLEAPDR